MADVLGCLQALHARRLPGCLPNRRVDPHRVRLGHDPALAAFPADHVGSLLRPPDLLAARNRHAAGELDDEGLGEFEDTAIRDVVRRQADVGLQTVTDGEFRRTSWHLDFIYQLGGIDRSDQSLSVHFRNEQGDLDFDSPALRVHDRVRLTDTIFGAAFTFLREYAAPTQTPKLTVPSPSMVHYRGGRVAIDALVCPEHDAFWADLTDDYAEEIRRLWGLGCTYLQLDDTSLAYLNDPNQRAMLAAQGPTPSISTRTTSATSTRLCEIVPTAWSSPLTYAAATTDRHGRPRVVTT